MVLSTSQHISWVFCTWSFMLSCKISNSSLDPYYLVWWSAFIWIICLFAYSGNTLLFSPPLFFKTRSHNLRSLVSQNLQYPSLFPKRWLKSLNLFHADGTDFNGTKTLLRTSTCLVKTHRYRDTFCIQTVIKSNHKKGVALFHLLLTVNVESTIFSFWVVWLKVITVVSTNHVVKIWMEVLTY